MLLQSRHIQIPYKGQLGFFSYPSVLQIFLLEYISVEEGGVAPFFPTVPRHDFQPAEQVKVFPLPDLTTGFRLAESIILQALGLFIY